MEFVYNAQGQITCMCGIAYIRYDYIKYVLEYNL